MSRMHPAAKILAVFLAAQLALPVGILHAASGTKIGHESPKDYIPGFRINLETKIEDPEGVLLARCYFRSRKDPTFVFADLAAAEKTWKTTLPAPWLGSEEVEYLFVVVNRGKKVFRSESFRIPEKKTPQLKKWKEVGEVREVRLDRLQEFAELYLLLRNELQSSWGDKLPDWQEPVADAALELSTELAVESAGLGGFWDTVAVSQVPKHLAYGLLVEGIYPTTQTGTAGAAAAATATGASGVGSSGTIGGGGSWLWYTLGAVAVVGAGAATALVVSSGDSDKERISVNMVVRSSNINCRTESTYSVETEDSRGRVLQTSNVHAYEVFKVNVTPGDFKVNWMYNPYGYWFGWRDKSTDSPQPLELPCIGYGESFGGGTRIW